MRVEVGSCHDCTVRWGLLVQVNEIPSCRYERKNQEKGREVKRGKGKEKRVGNEGKTWKEKGKEREEIWAGKKGTRVKEKAKEEWKEKEGKEKVEGRDKASKR